MNLEETTDRITRSRPASLPKAAAVAGLALVASLALAGEDSIVKDLHINQAPMLIVQPDGDLAGYNIQHEFIDAQSYADKASTLAVSASVDRDDGVYRAGDAVRISVEVTEDAYLWVFDTGTSGKVHRIFPNRLDQNNFVRAGAPVTIPGPDANYDFQVSHPRGRELLTVIATADDSPLVEHLVEASASNGSPFMTLSGNAASVAKDISVSLREDHETWARDVAVIRID